MRRCAERISDNEERNITCIRIFKDIIATRFNKFAIGEKDGSAVE
jgi:hypothetical protein